MYIVFYQIPSTKEVEGDTCLTLTEALNIAKWHRDNGNRFVTIASENPDSVGKPGVDSIVDGKCPDGIQYDWNKRDRIGRVKKERV